LLFAAAPPPLPDAFLAYERCCCWWSSGAADDDDDAADAGISGRGGAGEAHRLGGWRGELLLLDDENAAAPAVTA
jgi:hypothetical protein